MLPPQQLQQAQGREQEHDEREQLLLVVFDLEEQQMNAQHL